jgi:predicted acetyltransferase
MPELVAPAAALHTAWLEAHDEWGPGLHEDGFGLMPFDEVRSASGFAAWIERLAVGATPGKHRCTYRWIVEDGQVLGGIALRHGVDDDYVRGAGNIGYGVRPSARRRGLATWALERILAEARDLGMTRVLAVCALDNEASRRTLERSGGAYEGIGDSRFGKVHRYWFGGDPPQ